MRSSDREIGAKDCTPLVLVALYLALISTRDRVLLHFFRVRPELCLGSVWANKEKYSSPCPCLFVSARGPSVYGQKANHVLSAQVTAVHALRPF